MNTMARGHAVCAALLLACIIAAQASNTDLLGKTKAVAEHVAIIMVDGLHQEDLANYVAEFPNSNVAALAAAGVTYNNLFLPAPSDSWPALAHHITGAGPAQHGIIYESPYSRGLYAPKAACAGAPGTPVDYSEDSTNPTTALTNGVIDPSFFPLNKTLGCTPVYPNNWILVNTIFGVATAAGLKTAWSDKAIQYSFVAGPGNPLDLSDRITEFRPYSIDYLINKKEIPSQIEYDLLHANAIQSWIAGSYANGTATADGKPFNLFGSSFQALNAAQKSADTQPNGLTGANGNPNVYLSGGYGLPNSIPNDPSKTTATDPQTNTKIAARLNAKEVNSTAYFLAEVHTALAALDSTVGQTINALKKQGIYEKSVVILTSKHGNSPIDPSTLVRVTPAKITAAINVAIAPDTVANINADTAAYIWLKDNSAANVAAAAAVLNTPANLAAFRTSQVLTGTALQALLGDQADRIPDLVVLPTPGTLYTGSLAKVSDHGGAFYTDLHLGTIISGPAVVPGIVNDVVSATQIGVTALDLLGLDYTQLQGAAAEGTKPLPGLATGKSLASDVIDAVVKPIGAQISGDQKVINDVVG